ncbi:MAG TPA: anthrone oxygenase family protein [Actinophytocola sp.]|jgi:uncharacterized membrane protein|uniref:anthrone oxygenase family protein n=1 Tax=Actinophytocola sp. TaxID=1872138 RepID=UPI002E04A285|nr:anthrone oxygenase family protein [Actinophytocola sp.]
MIHGAPLVLTFTAAIGTGVAAGVFFTFDSFVMPGLRRLPAPQGIAAMQSINVTALRPPFMLELFGSAALCAVLIVIAIANWSEPYSGYLLAGGLAYIAGAVILTGAFHVPRNNALMAVDPETPAAAEYWTRYLREWTAGNVFRTLLCATGSGLLIAGLRAG